MTGRFGADDTRDRSITANGVEIAFVDRGPVDGDPVVLLHGWPDSSEVWRHQIPELVAGGHRVVAPDQRGFGRSDAPEGVAAYSIAHIVGDLDAVLADCGIGPHHLVGHDWGAAVSWAIARRTPERLRSLTVLSTGHPDAYRASGWDQREKSWYMLVFLHEGVAEDWLRADDWNGLRAFTNHHREADRWIADLSRPGRLTASLNWYRRNMPAVALVAPPRQEPAVPVDTLGIWSSGDEMLLEEQMIRSRERVSGTWRYERLDGSHWIPLDAADHLSDLLVDWLSKPRA